MKRIYYIGFLLFISCRNERKDMFHIRPTSLDTLTLCIDLGFLNCCHPVCQNFEINLQTPFKATPFLSTNAGISLRRDYQLGDSVLLNFVYEAIPIYDDFRMSYYINGYDPSMKTKDTIIDYGSKKLKKFWGTVDDKAVLNYVSFDNQGYLSFNVIDSRSLPLRNCFKTPS